MDPRRDRAGGALLGLAVGDALGTTLEFSLRDSEPRVSDMVGGGPFGLAPGEWTDDTSMALCLAESILERGAIDPEDLMRRFTAWWQDGDNSLYGICFDIGITTSAALQRFLDTGDPLSGSTDPRTAGNGSLMRLAPAAIRWWGDPGKARAAARLQSRTTHGAAQAVDACDFFAGLLVEAIAGKPKKRCSAPVLSTVTRPSRRSPPAHGAANGGTRYLRAAMSCIRWKRRCGLSTAPGRSQTP